MNSDTNTTLPQHGEPTVADGYRKPAVDSLVGCDICGGRQAEIRGRHPKDPRRVVCPTCLRERLDTICDMASEHYSKAYQTPEDA